MTRTDEAFALLCLAITQDIRTGHQSPVRKSALLALHEAQNAAGNRKMDFDTFLDRVATLTGSTVQHERFAGHEWVTFIPRPIGLPTGST